MFVKWDCGCVGINVGIVGPHAQGIVIRPCDEDRDAPRNALTWFARDMTGKTVEPLSDVAEANLHRALGLRLAKANRFDTVTQALGVTDDE